MEVILLERVEKLGTVGSVVRVKDGYARNFLFPRNKALRATAANKAKFEADRAEIVKQNEENRKEAEKAVSKFDKLVVTLVMQAGEDGRLFGSVTARNIAKAISDAAERVDHKSISIKDSIKYLGVYPVKVALHPEVSVQVHVNVARTETEAAEALKDFLSPSGKKKTKAQQDAEAAFNDETTEEESNNEEAA